MRIIAATVVTAAATAALASPAAAVHPDPADLRVTYTYKETRNLAVVGFNDGTARFVRHCKGGVLEGTCWIDYSGNRWDLEGKHAFVLLDDRVYSAPR